MTLEVLVGGYNHAKRRKEAAAVQTEESDLKEVVKREERVVDEVEELASCYCCSTS